jgi:hypothetical protein
MSETQSFLFEHSAELPEGLYIELMNKLKIDFDKKEIEQPKLSVIVIDRNIPSYIAIKKKVLIDLLITKSETFEHRTQFIQELMRKDYRAIKLLCKIHNIDTQKENPNWKRQSAAVTKLKITHAAAWSQHQLLT